MAVNVLVVGPSNKWLHTTKEFLRKSLYTVDTARNGKTAQAKMYQKLYFAMILHVNTKSHSGIEVMRFAQSNHPLIRIILVLEYPIPEDSHNDDEWMIKHAIDKYHIHKVMVKPFTMHQLKEALEECEDVSDILERHSNSLDDEIEERAEEEVKCEDDKFSKVKIEEFFIARPVMFDVFIKLRTNRYIKILHVGGKISEGRLDKYRNNKKIKYFYIKKDDLDKYIKFNNFLTKKAIESDKVEIDTKFLLLGNVSKKFLERSFYKGLSPTALDQGKELAENVYRLVSSDKDLYTILKEYQDFDPSAYNHGFLVTLFSTAIIKQFKWQSKSTMEIAALACLLHDIGKTKTDKRIINKRPEVMTKGELEQYRMHPEIGSQMLENNRLVPQSVRQIIRQHHESCDGSGFPFGLGKTKISTLSNIVHLADDFSRLIVERGIMPVDAIKIFVSEKGNIKKYHPTVMESFLKIFVSNKILLGEAANKSDIEEEEEDIAS